MPADDSTEDKQRRRPMPYWQCRECSESLVRMHGYSWCPECDRDYS